LYLIYKHSSLANNNMVILDGECIQTISHPTTSVWCVAAMPNGDIISGASDGVVRIFTRAEERIAEKNVLKVL
jgi:phospholipase A-2-activating protein